MVVILLFFTILAFDNLQSDPIFYSDLKIKKKKKQIGFSDFSSFTINITFNKFIKK